MSDYITMQNLIAKRVRLAASAVASGIQDDIKSTIHEAILFHKHEMYWFNQQDADADTVKDQEYYALPPAYMAMLNIKVLYDTNRYYLLHARAESEIDENNANFISSRPLHFCIHNEQLRLSPIPDDTYSMNMSYVRDIMVDSPLEDDTDTNEWMADAGPMIRYAAQSILWDDLVHDDREAAKSLLRSEAFKRQLMDRTRRYRQSTWISPQEF
jgi:hypothetical protein